MRALCAIHPPDTIRKVPVCLRLPSKPPPIASAVLDRRMDVEAVLWAGGTQSCYTGAVRENCVCMLRIRHRVDRHGPMGSGESQWPV